MADQSKDNPFMDMFQKFGENLKLPTPDIENVMEYHRKNIQAMQDATQSYSKGAQSMMGKQREVLEETLSEVTDYVQNAMQNRDPNKMISDNMEFAKKSFDATIKNTTEMSEIMRVSSSETYNILKDRMQESIEEIRDSMGKK
ncbi:MAG: TIGR01841 family phasin [Pseudomonadota bacterium]